MEASEGVAHLRSQGEHSKYKAQNAEVGKEEAKLPANLRAAPSHETSVNRGVNRVCREVCIEKGAMAFLRVTGEGFAGKIKVKNFLKYAYQK